MKKGEKLVIIGCSGAGGAAAMMAKDIKTYMADKTPVNIIFIGGGLSGLYAGHLLFGTVLVMA